MSGFEYKVIAAPTRGQKARGVKTPAARFALALQNCLNEEAQDGWEFVRAETLPAEERDGLMSKTTVFQNVLVFRRAIAGMDDRELTETVEKHIEDALEAEPEPALIEDHSGAPETAEAQADPSTSEKADRPDHST